MQRTYVVGTAGHVDHGKSSLVRRLTGIDPDRLQEEKARALTIDLGFAWLSLPGGASVSIVDVPGHERFIKNMLAGVGGIDAALLVIAADEGPMPQTTEHLAILDLLEIRSAIVAVTKADLVEPEWLDLVVEETRDVIAGTSIEGAPVLPVSAHTGEGLDELVARLEEVLTSNESRDVRGRARLPVDRVFSVAGFGTVVTGTLVGDSLRVGQAVEILPQGSPARIRGLQTHGETVDVANPGSRTAINLSGVDRTNVRRGDVVTVPHWMSATSMLDARLRLIDDAPRALEQNDPVDFFVGASERSAHVTLLDSEQIAPGSSGWVQIRFDDPVPDVDGDLFIVRQASPSLTIGGGKVVNAHPRRHRRFRPEVIAELESRASGSPALLLDQILKDRPRTLESIAGEIGQDRAEVSDLVATAVAEGTLVTLGASSGSTLGPNDIIAREDVIDRLTSEASEAISSYLERSPLRRGIPREELRSRMKLEPREFDAVIATLADRGDVDANADIVTFPGHEVKLSDSEERAAASYIEALNREPYSPPSPDDYGIESELLMALQDRGDVVRVADGVVFSSHALDEIRRETVRIIDEEGNITLAYFRDHFGSSRKYAQAVLEYFDQQQITRRVGDVRIRGRVRG
ncbi:MAG: selenocysteine-specific translation elongation factor [Chloroflexota bacterium]